MTHELILTSGKKESVLAHTKSEGMAKQMQKALSEHFESQVLIRPLDKSHRKDAFF